MAEHKAATQRFGAWSGVFTPSLLTILGVIMYLRLGWVVGEAGIIGAVLIILLAHAISVPTGLSIASLASNRDTGGGGVYYLISRSLGLPVGGAIGVTLFLATALGASLYIIGFAETVNALLGLDGGISDIRLTGTITLVVVTALTVFNASVAIKVQYFIIAAIILSVGSLLLGDSPAPPSSVQLWPEGNSTSLAVVFAIFFPAVTGFTAGVAMSGDLKNPRRDIPAGTLAAVGMGLVVYVSLAVFLGLTVDAAVLRSDLDIWQHMALMPQLVLAGVWGATLSSAIGSMLGAPRILQALALDGIGPRILATGSGDVNEPRIATVATLVIAECGILIGELDLVARVLTIFFLTTYGTLNLACGLERWSNPDFRPRLRVPALLSFVGAALCFGTMFKLDTGATAAALVALALLFLLVKQRQLKLESDNIWAGIWQSLVLSGLYRLRNAGSQLRTWRPNVLLFGGHPERRPHLLQMAQWVVREHGLLTNFNLLASETRHTRARGRREGTDPRRRLPGIEHYDDFELHSVFHTTKRCRSVGEGVRLAVDWYGLVGMEPNAAMLGWPSHADQHEEYARLVAELIGRDLNILLLDVDPEVGFGRQRRLDVWWGHNQTNGGLMLMLAHFIQSNAGWARARVRVVTVVDDPKEIEGRRKALKGLLTAGRVRAEVLVMDGSKESKPALEVLRQRSKRADLVILGVDRPKTAKVEQWVLSQSQKTNSLPAVLRVSASALSEGGKPLGLEADAHKEVDAQARQGLSNEEDSAAAAEPEVATP